MGFMAHLRFFRIMHFARGWFLCRAADKRRGKCALLELQADALGAIEQPPQMKAGERVFGM